MREYSIGHRELGNRMGSGEGLESVAFLNFETRPCSICDKEWMNFIPVY